MNTEHLKAVTLWQPWATLVVLGLKRFETRGTMWRYRGPLLIHAAKRWQKWQRELLLKPPFRELLEGVELPRSAILGRVDVVGSWTARSIAQQLVEDELGERELQLGNYSPGRWAIALENPVRFDEPIPAKGQQGIFHVDPKIHPTLEALL